MIAMSVSDSRSSGKGRDPEVTAENEVFGMEGVVGEGLGS
jgi:hypothetical protein